MSPRTGAVACGHPVTLDAASRILRAGGNAFDAAAAGLWTACVAEPLLVAPGGGGFLLARRPGGPDRLYDFFTQTPRRRRPRKDEDFREIHADFGTVRQAFHIGLGAAATPGLVAGAFAFQRDLGRLPIDEVMQPALRAAREGVEVTELQLYLASILRPILQASEEVRRLYRPGGQPVARGERHRQPELADFLEALVREGADLFYRGEVARRVARACREGGGHLTREDFEGYRVVVRRPLEVSYRGRRISTNPPPASGGLLVAFGLECLRSWTQNSRERRIIEALAAMDAARGGEGLDEGLDPAAVGRVLSTETVARYREVVRRHPPSPRGTTHISVIDDEGNAASLTVSNGEGCGWAVPGCGFMLNNMLGEADLQPRGFGRWPPNTRLTSMMAPTLVDGGATQGLVALGSGGSNRIRSAILQVLTGLLDEGLDLEAAVEAPRLHVEGSRLEVEGGFPPETVDRLVRWWSDHVVWPQRNLFFGGVHAVRRTPGGFSAYGDPRRGGVAAVLDG